MTPDPSQYAMQHEVLDRCVRGDWRHQSVQHLRTYFRDDRTNGFYTGCRFERLEGGGDAAAFRNQITAADVLSLTFLSISDRLPAVTMDAMDVQAERIATLLAALPTDLTMHEAEWELFARGSTAFQLWNILRQCGGKNRWVTANKLLARKRPHLLPAYDNDVEQLLGEPDSFWACLWSWFAADRGRHHAVDDLRREAGDIEDISLLRCLDVVLWMRAR